MSRKGPAVSFPVKLGLGHSEQEESKKRRVFLRGEEERALGCVQEAGKRWELSTMEILSICTMKQ